MSDFLDWMEKSPGTAAWVQAVFTIIALVAAIFAPWWQGRVDRRANRSSLRHALRVEVRAMSTTYLDEFDRWEDPEFLKHPRPPQIPALVVFDANAEKIGLLSDDEILAFSWLSARIKQLSMLVDGMTEQQLREAREDIQVLLSFVCGNAAFCLQPLPGSLKDEDEIDRHALHNSYMKMEPIRKQRKLGHY